MNDLFQIVNVLISYENDYSDDDDDDGDCMLFIYNYYINYIIHYEIIWFSNYAFRTLFLLNVSKQISIAANIITNLRSIATI